MLITNKTQQSDTAGSSGSSSTGSASSSTTSSSDASKDMFLKLLVAQVRNQNPLSPMDPSGFVGELAQFTGLEETITMRTTLEDIRTLLKAQSSGGKLPVSGTDGTKTQ